MRLSLLVADDARIVGELDPEVTGLALDSRKVRRGDLFAALAGTKADGLRFVGDACSSGAVAVLGPHDLLERPLTVPKVVADDPRRTLARVAARFYAPQPETVVAVTGTSGKTSIVGFVRQLWSALGHDAASLGTLGLVRGEVTTGTGLTTPDTVTLHALLHELTAGGVTHLALEASSHALDQRRLDGVRITAAAFSNLSRDHFDYHGSIESYRAAKARLFSDILSDGGTAVLNADSPELGKLQSICRARGLRILDYGRQGQALRLVDQRILGAGQALCLDLLGHRVSFETGLVGPFQAWNLLAAIGLVLSEGIAPATLAAALPKLVAAPGRMQLVTKHENGAAVFVDYAHKPDALEQALRALRGHATGRVVVVFGCGGDRDAGKRPEMGTIAADLADIVIVTDDNPRSEDPAEIRRQVLASCPAAREIGDRAEAIAAGLALLGPGDALLIAGKGHETGQIVGGRTLPFDDVEVTLAAARARGGFAT